MTKSMKTTRTQIILVLTGLLAWAASATAYDVLIPSLDSWQTSRSGQFARIRTNHSATTMTVWTNKIITAMGPSMQYGVFQWPPVWADVNWIGYASPGADFIYVGASGMPSYTMGPWFLDSSETQLFPNLPLNQRYTASFPRFPQRVSSLLTRSNTPVDISGMFVNGTAVFNMLVGYWYQRVPGDPDPNHGSDVQHVTNWTTGVWQRNAYPSEKDTFDVNNSHQSLDGQIHLHINPTGLRLQLKDNVLALASVATGEITEIFEHTDNHHSPILGWAFDGFPIYGPYGYSDTNNALSTVRRMVSGYVLRNGQYGTSNLDTMGRTSLPVWAMEVQGRTTTTLATAEWGPSTNKAPFPSYALGRYAEDYDYLGDLPASARVGVEWDLDRCNSRYCVTPEFPNKIWAYFVTIDSNGVPVFPFILGPQYCGNVTGGSGVSVPDGATTYFSLFKFQMFSPELWRLQNDMLGVLLRWPGIEGGQYRILKSDNLQNWTTAISSVIATGSMAQVTFTQAVPPGNRQFWRVALESLPPYDPVERLRGTILSVVPNGAPGGSTLPVNITLGPSATPPAGLPTDVRIGNAPGSNVQREGNTITATFHFLTGPPRTVDVTVTFSLPQPPGAVFTSTLVDGFTIN